MILLAKVEPGSAAGLVWEKAGAEGALEVHPFLARELLAIPGDHFFIVDKPAEKAAPAKKAAPKAEKVEAKAEDTPAIENEIEEAVEAASPTKKRATKE